MDLSHLSETSAVVLESREVLLIPGVEIEDAEDDDLPAPAVALANIDDGEDGVCAGGNATDAADGSTDGVVVDGGDGLGECGVVFGSFGLEEVDSDLEEVPGHGAGEADRRKQSAEKHEFHF